MEIEVWQTITCIKVIGVYRQVGRLQPVGHVHLVASMKEQRGDNSAAVMESGILTTLQREMEKRKGTAGLGSM